MRKGTDWTERLLIAALIVVILVLAAATFAPLLDA